MFSLIFLMRRFTAVYLLTFAVLNMCQFTDLDSTSSYVLANTDSRGPKSPNNWVMPRGVRGGRNRKITARISWNRTDFQYNRGTGA